MNERTVLPAHIRIRKTREQRHEPTGYETVSVSGLAQTDKGWELAVDVVELRRVPDTANVVATLPRDNHDAGDVASYERLHRYNRGRTNLSGEASSR